jgi:hypothetical protein
MPDLLHSTDEATRLALDIKDAPNTDVEHARGVDQRVVQGAIFLAHAEAIPSPAGPGFKAYEVPLEFPN